MTSNVYTVQIDSNYRNLAKYPLSTDFKVRFNNESSSLSNSLNGFPINGANNLQSQIDPDFVRSSFTVVNGSLQHIQRDTLGNFYISGTIDVLQLGGQFEILQDNYRIFSINTNTIPNVFVGKFTPIGSSFYLSWINYLVPTQSPYPVTSYRIPPSRSTLEIDVSGNVYWIFDSSYTSVNVYSSLLEGIVYNIYAPDYYSSLTPTQRQYQVICAFTTNGDQYAVNGVPWGYHILSMDDDILPTLENGRSYIKSNTALDLFTTINTNPYDPRVYKWATNVGDITTSFYMFYLNTGSPSYDANPRALYFFQNTDAGIVGFKYYKITSDGFQYLSEFTNITNPSWIPLAEFGYWTLHYAITSTTIYISCPNSVSDGSGKLYLVTFDLVTETATKVLEQSLGYYPPNPPLAVGTRSGMSITLSTDQTMLYIALDNIGFVEQKGSMLYSLDLSNIPAGCTRIYIDETTQSGNYGEGYSILNYNNYILVVYQGINNNTSAACFTIHKYNTTSATVNSIIYPMIGFFSLTLTTSGYALLFKGLDNELYCFLTVNYGGVIFGINADDLFSAVTYISQIDSYGETRVIFYNSGDKEYLIGKTSGRIYDISTLKYPYQLTELYPKSIPSNYVLSNFQIIYTTELNGIPVNGGILGGVLSTSTSNPCYVFTTKFLDVSSTLNSNHYSKPIVNYVPTISTNPDSQRYWDIFTIPGNQTNVSTNFSPIQFINNGLVAWYKCTESTNLIFNGGTGSHVVGILDLSGNGLDLYADEVDPVRCPEYNKSAFTNNQNMLLWLTQANQTSSFTSQNSWTTTPIKFIIATYKVTSFVDYPNVIPIECSSSGTVNAQITLTGTNMRYSSGIYTTSWTPGLNISAADDSPVYFGYNTPDIYYPFLAAGPTKIDPVTGDLVPTTNAINKIKIMQNLDNTLASVSLKELIVLDFIPTEYQLSLFQYYLNSAFTTFSQVIPPLAGVYSLYNSPQGGSSALYVKQIDGSSIPFTVMYPIVPFFYPTDYVDVKHIRNSSSLTPNYVTTIASDNIARVYRLNDYLQYPVGNNYSQVDLSSIGWPLYDIEPYIDENDLTRMVISTYDTNPATSQNSANFIHLVCTEGSPFDNLVVSSTLQIPNPYTDPNQYFGITTFKVYKYDNNQVYLFTILSENYYDSFSGGIYGIVFQIYNITNPNTFVLVYQSPPSPVTVVAGGTSSNRFSSSVHKYPDGGVYFIAKNINGGESVVYNVSVPTVPVKLPNIPAGKEYYPFTPSFPIDRTESRRANPISMFTNPLTNKVYSVDSSNVLISGNLKGQISIFDYTNLLAVPSNYSISPEFWAINPSSTLLQLYDNTDSNPVNIRTTVWNQKVWAMIVFKEYGGNTRGTAFFDLSNVEYVSQNYKDNLTTTKIYEQMYHDIKGIGVGVIHKITNGGIPNWVSNLGGDGVSGNNKWATNVNISNIDLDNTLTFGYIAGSWKNKIQALVDADVNGNPITPYKLNSITSTPLDTSVNSFICKLNINDGKFVWMTPTFGTNDDYFQRLMFNSSNSTLSVSSYFSSPVMLIYTPQTSVTSGWTNPVNTILNISNPSQITSALFTLDTNGLLKWSTKLYSTDQIAKTKMYDVYIEDKTITCLLSSNATKLSCIDSSLTQVQDTYSNINPLTQTYVALYTFDYSGNYIKSERTELPPGLQSSLFDIKSYSTLNRIVYFINCFTSQNNGSIKSYNKDGSFGGENISYPLNTKFSKLFEYQFDSTFKDTNGLNYSKVVLKDYQYTGAQSLQNYKLFIQGGAQQIIPDNVVITYLNSELYLNTNFSIRNYTLSTTDSTIILNSVIPTNKIIRNNLPYQNLNWLSSISATPLYGIVSYATGTNVNPNNYIFTQFFCNVPSLVSTTGTYYIVYNTPFGYNISPISSITNNRGLYQFTTTTPISNNSNTPFAYLTTYDSSVDYTLQFYPASITNSTFFNVVLNNLTIPDRPILNSPYPGVRYLNDYPYIYFMIINTDQSGNLDNQILNNFFTTNINKNANAIFTIPITSAGGSGNYITIGSGLSAKIKFTPGLYNIRIALFDPNGNIIVFDNTPIKTIDSIFKDGVVPDKLMNIIATVTMTQTV